MKFRLLTYFFYNFLTGDSPVNSDTLDGYDAVQYYFFTNFLTRQYLWDVQILLRFQLKTEYTYTDIITPLELLHLLRRAEQIEEERKKLDETK